MIGFLDRSFYIITIIIELILDVCASISARAVEDVGDELEPRHREVCGHVHFNVLDVCRNI